MTDADSPDLAVTDIDLLRTEVRCFPAVDRPPIVSVRDVPLLNRPPWVRTIGKLGFELTTQGWRFPSPGEMNTPPADDEGPPAKVPVRRDDLEGEPRTKTRVRPPTDVVMLKDRLLYLLQPPLEDLFAGKQVQLPFPPYPYQIKGVAFLMPRHGALLADEMGLGKTAQVIIALRLLFHAGLIRRALIVCPKPLVINWTRELNLWADDVPYEILGGDTRHRQAQWLTSKSPVKLVNYELLTRDADLASDPRVHFDVAVLDEAQRIKNRSSKAAQAARGISRDRSWAMTGTPIENRVEDLINLFAFIDPERVPTDTPARALGDLTRDCILRRVKEDVCTDMPPKLVKDAYVELTPAQREAYDRAERDGVIHLNDLGDTLAVQHVFELVMRLKQICNFDPRTGESAKLDMLVADIEEVAESKRKAIVFSQWVEPLEAIARALRPYGPVQYHGKIAQRDRQPILDRFKTDPKQHVLLMSYGTGSVGLNLQFTNYVFLFDRWWNPAVEDQAINRAHRLGQKETVFVTRFVAQNTIEERIAQVLEKKRQIFEETIGQNGPPPALGMSEEEIFGLFDVKARPRRHAA